MRLGAGLGLLACLLGLFFLCRGSEYVLFSLSLPALHGVTLPHAAPTPERAESAPIPLPLYVEVDEGVGREVRITVLAEPKAPPAMDLSGPEPKILIYHTHTTEAYTKSPGNDYEEKGEWRTNETDKNIVAVGKLLTTLLRDEYGFAVLHDTTNHEPPKLATAYARSLSTMEAYKKRYPSLTMFIDVHRDAGGENTSITLDGEKVARLMFVVGTGEGATGTGFAQMPDFESNYALALSITNRLSAINPKLTRNIRVKTGRYNQHISSQCLLVEVGDNMSTLEEALNAIPYLAKAIAAAAEEGAAMTDAAPAVAPSPIPTKRPGLWVPGA